MNKIPESFTEKFRIEKKGDKFRPQIRSRFLFWFLWDYIVEREEFHPEHADAYDMDDGIIRFYHTFDTIEEAQRFLKIHVRQAYSEKLLKEQAEEQARQEYRQQQIAQKQYAKSKPIYFNFKL